MSTSRQFFAATVFLVSLLLSSSAWAVTAPYTETFDAEADCNSSSCGMACSLTNGWIQSANDDFDWFVESSATGSSNTGPTGDHTSGSGKYVFTEASSCTAQVGSLITPPLELTTATAPAAAFWYHMYGQSMGTLHVDVLDGSLALLASDVVVLTDDINLWQPSPIIDLSAYVGQTIHLQFRGIIGTSFYSDMAIDDFSLVEVPADDVGVVSIDSPIDGCGLGNAETVSVTIENVGSAAQTGFSIQYSLDGGAPVTETFTGTVAPFSTATFSFAAGADVSAPGFHAITVTTLLAGDADPSNDTASGTVYGGSAVSTFPSLEDFEGASAPFAWVAGGTSSSWELGTPNDTTIDTAYSGTQSWITGITLNYNSNESSFVQSLCGYDFSTLQNPAVQLATYIETFDIDDGASLQASTDGGATWATIGGVGTGQNWYNSAAITANPGGEPSGWTDDVTKAWLLSLHDIAPLAGQSSVHFRIAFASDGTSVDDGVAFDDFEIFDNVIEEVVVTGLALAPPVGAVQPGSTDVLAQALLFQAYGIGSKDVTSITITNGGTLPDADVTAVSLYADDGDLVFDPALDTMLDSQMLVGGTATLGATGLSVPTLGSAVVYVSYDVASTATAGDTFSSQIAAPTTDIVIAGSPTLTVANPPLAGPLLTVSGVVDMLPFLDDFSSLPANRFGQWMAGAYPTATAVGTTVGSQSYTNAALVEVISSSTITPLLPVDGTHFAAISFPNGDATGAIDYHFDLSAYNATTDTLLLQFRWADAGEEIDDPDYIFVSLDGGATWAAALFEWPWLSNSEVWADEEIDLSAFLTQNALNYTNDVVIRFQANDDTDLDLDGLMIDRVWLGRPMKAAVERLGTDIPDDGTDALGAVAATPQSLAYTLRNLGDLPLDWTAIVTANETNVTNVVVTPPTTDPIPPNTDVTFQVDFDAGLGAFSFEIDVLFAEEPQLFDNKLDWTVTGEGNEAIPEIDVQRPEGTSIASGMNDPQGTLVPGVQQTLTYTVENLGFADLTITAASIENAVNTTASIVAQPSSPLAPGATTTFDVAFAADANGPFSFDVVVANNDGDEGTYTITVDGDADDGMGGSGGGGGGGVGGGGVGGAGGSPAVPPPGEIVDDGGCGCSTPGGNGGKHAPWALAGLAFALGMVRRRRSRC